MANLLVPLAKQQFFLPNGSFNAFGLVYTYQAGTTTPLTTYNASGGVNTNPIVLDAFGRADIWVTSISTALKLNVTDAVGNQILGWPIDNIQIPGALSASGTFTMTGTGFSGTAPSVTATYAVLGGSLAVVNIPTGLFGASNATSFGLSGIPTVLQPPTQNPVVSLPWVENAGSVVNSGVSLSIINASNTWYVLLNGSQAGFTSSGAKGFSQAQGNVISYLIL